MPKFPLEEKWKGVDFYLNGNERYRNLAKRLGVEPKTFHYWIKTYEYHGVDAFIKT